MMILLLKWTVSFLLSAIICLKEKPHWFRVSQPGKPGIRTLYTKKALRKQAFLLNILQIPGFLLTTRVYTEHRVNNGLGVCRSSPFSALSFTWCEANQAWKQWMHTPDCWIKSRQDAHLSSWRDSSSTKMLWLQAMSASPCPLHSHCNKKRNFSLKWATLHFFTGPVWIALKCSDIGILNASLRWMSEDSPAESFWKKVIW